MKKCDNLAKIHLRKIIKYPENEVRDHQPNKRCLIPMGLVLHVGEVDR